MSDANAALALSTIALVPTIFGSALPPLAIVHDKTDASGALAAQTVNAAVCATGVVLGMAIVTRSPGVLIAGGMTIAVYTAMYRQAILQ